MAENLELGYDLRIIQQNYGNKMCQLCAEAFPDILRIPGILSQVLLNQYEPSFTLYDELMRNNQINEFTLEVLRKSRNMMNYREFVASQYDDPMVRADILDGMDPFGDFSK